ncbi:GtrA family protein [Novosphingobium profundi]|uniref:GtrA family protein n=1 Tax=Novosphingobium profundi TaxID=1774954 RepID=UPI001BDB640B|nr:GtrA family protein [Novosphingobium profundi]MBT0667204.1 GtrA family protein [Novosphingobium profundi]
MSRRRNTDIREEAWLALRFGLVGLANTAIGYGLIVACLFAGLGDYGANLLGFAMGFPISYALHRRLTYRRQDAMNLRDMHGYAAAFAAAYGLNLGVVALGRAMGHAGSPLVQALAVIAYALCLFGLTRCFVFRSGRARRPEGN